MSTPAEFEWDEDKAATNIAKHGVAFEAIEALYADPEHVIVDTSRHADGEPRFKLIAQVEGRLFTAVCTMRGAACRVISLRRVNASEERIYGHGPLQA
ncbi:MAG TPA: BrnT family toxin [Beijerinckiaceae bacterium]